MNMDKSATRNELKALNELLNDWNSSVELNLFNYLFYPLFHEWDNCCCITMKICQIRDKYYINVQWY
jgi:hypothetical protein